MKNVTNKKDKAVLIACVVMLIINMIIWASVFVNRCVVEKTTITATEVTGTAYVLNENGEWEPLDLDRQLPVLLFLFALITLPFIGKEV